MELSQEKNPYDLIDAVKSGDIEKVKFYLDNGYDVNYVDERDWDRKTSLHYGAENGHLDICKLLLEAGAQVNAANDLNQTSLHFGAMEGHFDSCKLLLEAGAQVNAADDENKTSLHYADKNQHLDIFKLLLDVGAERDNELSLPSLQGHPVDCPCVDSAAEIELVCDS
ncbi:uncharacterized protein LOC144450368 [Glandiceps talaboti]